MYIIWQIFEMPCGKTSLPALVCDPQQHLSQSERVNMSAKRPLMRLNSSTGNPGTLRKNSDFVVTMETSPFD